MLKIGIEVGDRKRVFFIGLKGFTLVELLFVTALLGLIFPAILQSFISCSILNEINRNRAVAITHAQFVMEEIKNTDFSNITSKINNGDWDWSGTTIGSKGLSALNNEGIDTQVSGADLLNITVTVSWQDRTGRTRNVSLTTQIAEE